MKLLIGILLFIGLTLLSWYLFIRPFEFHVNFKVRTLPGDVIETIRIWDRSMENTQIISVDSLNSLKQKITWNDRTYSYDWYFHSSNDTTTTVTIKISEPGNTFNNKLLIPFSNQPIEQDAREVSLTFLDIIKTHLEITDVKIEGEAQMPPLFCACTTLETKQVDKAKGMMRDYNLLTSFVSEFELKVSGPPVVKILNWNHSLGTLKFNFCFPIIKPESLPLASEISYKEIVEPRVLKAIYHGNYITSDRAWYHLIYHAQTNGYEINGFPIEYFYNNPNLGVDEDEWKAEIFLPIR